MIIRKYSFLQLNEEGNRHPIALCENLAFAYHKPKENILKASLVYDSIP